MESRAPTLSTERLSLRPLVEADFSALALGLGDREVSRWLRTVPHPYGIADARAFFEIVREGREQASLEDFVITTTNDGRLVGGIGLRFSEDSTEAALGYWIAREHWGCGYATEAARRVVGFAMRERQSSIPLARIEAHAYVGNERSRRVLTHCGFTEIAIETIEGCGPDSNQRAHLYRIG